MPETKRDPYPGYGRNPHRGVAYAHYVKTGEICDVWGGRHNTGSGAPQEPMGEHEFYSLIQKYPRPTTHNPDEPADEMRDAAVDALLHKSQITQTACREGWLVGLYDFARFKGRLPRRDEVGELRQAADFVARASHGSMSLGPFHQAMQKLADAIMERRGKLMEVFAR